MAAIATVNGFASSGFDSTADISVPGGFEWQWDPVDGCEFEFGGPADLESGLRCVSGGVVSAEP